MCGIVGYLNLNNKPLSNTACILSMLKIQKHRGPDDAGVYAYSLKNGDSVELPISKPVAVPDSFDGFLGFNRLSILDLSVNGHQPMASPDRKSVLIFNGEIYNAFEFKKELSEWGYHFKSNTDTEIILALFLKYGFEGMLSRLNGMFAIALIDLNDRKLYIARDRFGIKPLYYILNTEVLAFSSELKSFGFLDGFKYSLDKNHLDEYLLFRNTLRGTLLKDVQSLIPGHYLTYTLGHGFEEKEFFNINDLERANNTPGNLQTFKENLRQGLTSSVQSQLMSDVKLGCQLSGGVDSSLVTYFANQSSTKGQFESVSIVMNNSQYSEEKYIDRVAEQLKLESHKFNLDSQYYFNHIEKATWHLETPLNHPNTIGIYYLSQQAKKYVTVLLSGEGADEVFGGYRRYYDACYPYRLVKLISDLKNNLNHPGYLPLLINASYRAVMASCYMHPSVAVKLKPDLDATSVINKRIQLYKSLTGSAFDKQVKYEILSYLPDLLIRQDKMSMAHSIENRVPFLDNNVVIDSFKIPEKYLIIRKKHKEANTEKYILKKVTADIFDTKFAFRNKMGFGIPLKEFLSNLSFNEYLNDKILPGIKQRGHLKYAYIEKWISKTSQLSYEEVESLWIAVAYEIWASIYLDGNYENRHSS